MEPDNSSPFFYRCRTKAVRNESDAGDECARSSASGKRACSDDSGNYGCDRQEDSTDLPERGSSAGRGDSD